jgi:hypothetical protein
MPVPVEHTRWVYIGPEGIELGLAPIGDWTETIWRQEAPGDPWIRMDTPGDAVAAKESAAPERISFFRSPYLTGDEVGMTPCHSRR